jgi:hypothetical protein
LQRQALKGLEKILDKEHPWTLASMNGLTEALRHQGKYEEAGKLQRQALEGFEKILGREHPFTLTSMNDFANALDS